jgi:hypothetical protein
MLRLPCPVLATFSYRPHGLALCVLPVGTPPWGAPGCKPCRTLLCPGAHTPAGELPPIYARHGQRSKSYFSGLQPSCCAVCECCAHARKQIHVCSAALWPYIQPIFAASLSLQGEEDGRLGQGGGPSTPRIRPHRSVTVGPSLLHGMESMPPVPPPSGAPRACAPGLLMSQWPLHTLLCADVRCYGRAVAPGAVIRARVKQFWGGDQGNLGCFAAAGVCMLELGSRQWHHVESDLHHTTLTLASGY